MIIIVSELTSRLLARRTARLGLQVESQDNKNARVARLLAKNAERRQARALEKALSSTSDTKVSDVLPASQYEADQRAEDAQRRRKDAQDRGSSLIQIFADVELESPPMHLRAGILVRVDNDTVFQEADIINEAFLKLSSVINVRMATAKLSLMAEINLLIDKWKQEAQSDLNAEDSFVFLNLKGYEMVSEENVEETFYGG